MKNSIACAIAGAILALGAVSCSTLFGPDTFTVPEIGTRFDTEKAKNTFVYDEELKERVINLNRYKAISYGSFELYPNKAIDFYAPLNTNAKDQARWYLRMPKDSQCSCNFTAFYTEMPIGAQKLEDLETQFKEKLEKQDNVTGYDMDYAVQGPNRVINYSVSAKEEKTGRIIAIDGTMFIDVNHPDHFYTVSTERRAFNRARKDAVSEGGTPTVKDMEINDPRMLEAVKYFFQTFRPAN